MPPITTSDMTAAVNPHTAALTEPQPPGQVVTRADPQLDRLQKQIQQADVGIVGRQRQKIEHMAADDREHADRQLAERPGGAQRAVGRRREPRDHALDDHDKHAGDDDPTPPRHEVDPNLTSAIVARRAPHAPVRPSRSPRADRPRQTFPGWHTSRNFGRSFTTPESSGASHFSQQGPVARTCFRLRRALGF